VLAAAGIGLLLGLGAVSVASAINALQDRDLGDPVMFDPARVTVTPTPAPTQTTTATPTATLDMPPRQVVPDQPSPADDDDDADETDD
jgi:hypothetical protein